MDDDAIDAVNICNTAKFCIGYRKETILATAIDDMVRAFDKEIPDWFPDFLADARLALAEKKKMIFTSGGSALTLRELADDLQDATNILNTAKTCVGTKKNVILERAMRDHASAQDEFIYVGGRSPPMTPIRGGFERKV